MTSSIIPRPHWPGAALCDLHWLSEVDSERPPEHLAIIHVVNGGLGVLLQLELYEGEPSVLLCLEVHGHIHLHYVTEGDKRCLEHLLVHLVSQTSYIDNLLGTCSCVHSVFI